MTRNTTKQLRKSKEERLAKARVNDLHPAWLQYLIEETPGLEYLHKPFKKWQLPRGVRLQYSKVSAEHKAAARRREKRKEKRRAKGGGEHVRHRKSKR